MDLSKLSQEDLQAISSGDMAKVSTEGLQHISSFGAPPVAPEPELSTTQKVLQNLKYNLTPASEGRSTLSRDGNNYSVVNNDVDKIIGSISDQFNPMIRPVDKAVSYTKGLGSASGFNPLNNALQKYVSNPIANKLLQAFGSQNTAEQGIESNNRVINQATQNEPVSNMAGSVASSIVGAPAAAESLASPLISKLPSMGGVIPSAIRGGLGSGVYEAVSNPDASLKSIGNASLKGGGIAAGITGGLKGISKLADLWTSGVVGKAGLGEFVNTNFGPTSSKSALIDKNNSLYERSENQLQSVLQTMDKHTDIKIPLGEIELPAGDIKKLADTFGNLKFPERPIQNRLMDIYGNALKNDSVSLADANFLKRQYYKMAKFNKFGDAASAMDSQSAQGIGARIKDSIEGFLPKEVANRVRGINGNIASSIELDKALSKQPSKILGTTRSVGELAAMISNPSHAIPAVAAERIATSVPFATTLGSSANAASQATQNPLVQMLEGLAQKGFR